MACGCSSPGCSCRGGKHFEPFPRQVLIGRPAGPMNYFSGAMDLLEYKTLSWSFEVGANLDAGNTTPATMYLYGSDDPAFEGGGEDLIPGGESPTVASTERGTVELKARYVRVRIEIDAGQAAAVAVWLVARES